MAIRPTLKKLREVCRALPETTEKEAWGAPTFRVRDRMFAMYIEPGTHHGRESVWIKATKDDQQHLIAANPSRYFNPPYMGPSGWVGAYLDKRPAWSAIAVLLEDGYRMVAPKRLVKELDAG